MEDKYTLIKRIESLLYNCSESDLRLLSLWLAARLDATWSKTIKQDRPIGKL